MPRKKNPLENARKRVKEKLSSIEEQSEFICQFINDLTNKVTDPATELLQETERTKFFSKYSSVSQELEKCLDILLLISDSITSLAADEELEDDELSEASQETTDPSGTQEQTCKDSRLQSESQFTKSTKDKPAEILKPEESAAHGKEYQEKAEGAQNAGGLLSQASSSSQVSQQTPGTQPGVVGVEVIGEKTDNEKSTDRSIYEVTEMEVCNTPGGPALSESPAAAGKGRPSQQPSEKTSDETIKNTRSPASSTSEDVSTGSPHKSGNYPGFQADAHAASECSKKVDKETAQGSSPCRTSVPGTDTSLSPDSFHSAKTSLESSVGAVCPQIKPGVGKSSGNMDDSLRKDPSTDLKWEPTPGRIHTGKAPVDAGEPRTTTHIPNKNSRKHGSEKATKKATKKASSAPHKTRKVVTVSRRTSSSSSIHDVVREIKVIQSVPGISDFCHAPPNKAVYLKPHPFENGSCLDVVVSEVLSPWEFWLQPSLDDFNDLMEQMCFYYAKAAAAGYKGGLTEAPSAGSFCCAKFSADDTWYRVVVAAVHAQENNPRFEVLCVDDGQRDMVPLSNLRPLEERFADLPCQAICCALCGVQPRPADPSCERQSPSVWDKESTEWLKSKVQAVKLLAYPTRTDDGRLVTVDLYRCPGTKTPAGQVPAAEFSISQQMITAGKCGRICLTVPADSRSTRSPSPRSCRSEESLSRCSSLTSVSSSVPDCAVAESHNEAASRGLPDSSELQLDSSGHQAPDSAQVLQANSAAIPHEPSPLPSVEPQEGAFVAAPAVDAPLERAPVEAPPVDVRSRLIQVMMSHVVSPSEFYVHLATPQAGLLDSMMEDMNTYYNENGGSFEETPQVGHYCCARFSADKRWYRVRVMSFGPEDRSAEDDVFTSATAEVFYVDFGDTERVSVADLRPLETQFAQLPAQVFRCSLANTQPPPESGQQPPPPPESDQTPVVTTPPAPGAAAAESLSTKREAEEYRNTNKDTEMSPNTNKDSETSPKAKSGPRKSPNMNRPILKARRRRRGKPIKIDESVVVRAAGDESCGSSDMSERELVKFLNKVTAADSDTRGSNQSVDKVGLPEKYLLQTEGGQIHFANPVEVIPALKWTEEATELFKGLCEDEKLLVAHIVPWDAHQYDKLYNTSLDGEQVDISLQTPELSLYLYDTAGDEDIFVNQVLAETGVAVFVEPDVAGPVPPADINVVTLTEEELREAAGELGDSPELVRSPTSQMMMKWDPMSSDFLSVKNTYAIDTDDPDIAFQGYKDPSPNLCRFYRTKGGCWRGASCPDVHANEGSDALSTVQAFCDNVDSAVPLPDPGTWVAVCVTAVFDPGHFWVQFPYGPEPVEKQIIGARRGEGPDEGDNLEILMDEMMTFYSSNVCQDPSRILNAIGEIVVAKYSKDGKWYRARVTDLRDEEVQVFFVDYGNSEWTAESNIKRMIPHFLHLPFQAVECFLANVEPLDEDGGGWSDGAKRAFKSFAADKVVIAHVLSRAWNKTLYLDLYDTAGAQDVHINKTLVEKQFAKESSTLVTTPWDMASGSQKVLGLPG